MNKEELIAFEDWCIQTYKDGKLRSPLHLSRGNEEQLIEIFKEIKPNDWVVSNYRSHYHSLLKGVDPEWLKQWILSNKSIHVMNKEHKIITSAIVGGTLPVALGIAMGIKRKFCVCSCHHLEPRPNELNCSKDKCCNNSTEYIDIPHVWCFIGDMTASLGVFRDCVMYAFYNKLPITFIIEDNGLSTDTKTAEAWGPYCNPNAVAKQNSVLTEPELVRYYKYERQLPHYGCGVFIDFKEEGLKQDGKNF